MKAHWMFGLAALSLSACMAGDVSDMDGDEAALPDAPSEDGTSVSVEAVYRRSCTRGADSNGPYNQRLDNPGSHNANRYDHPGTSNDLWSLAAGTTLYDGLGNARGTVSSRSVKINFGQRKTLRGAAHVYAFAVYLTSGQHVSGWVPQSAVDPDIARMRTANAPNPHEGEYESDFVLTGGNLAEYGNLKVIPNFTETNGAASDYLVRPGNVLNMLYNLPCMGGVSNDTLPLGARFRRARVEAHAIPLYRPGGQQVVDWLVFVYGHVNGRYGWIARDALTAVPRGAPAPSPTPSPAPTPAPTPTPAPAPTPTPAPAAGGHGRQCRPGGSCDAGLTCHNNVCYQSRCCARCNNRQNYYWRMVSEDCTAAARRWCEDTNRGGLGDAMWGWCEAPPQ